MSETELSRAISFTIPVRLVSVANLREHWAKKAKRAREHRRRAYSFAQAHGRRLAPPFVPPLPAIVTLTRIAPRKLDGDNLQSACKNTRDGIADALGVQDNDPRVEWRYAQRKGLPRQYACAVTIERKETA